MNFYGFYPKSEFEPLADSKKSKKKSKKQKKFFKKAKKFLKKLRGRVVNMILSTVSQMALHFFDKKLEKAFA